MDYAIVSEKGDRQINEDSAAAVECDGNMLFVLADGLGGHGHGEVASGIVTETARAVLSEKKCGFEELDNLIETVIEDAQAKLFERQEKDGVVLYKFLMDLDEYKATYEVSFGLAIGKGFYEPPRVACPLPAQMKYPETNCVGQRATTSVSTFEFKLPYYFRLDSGEFVTVTAEYADDGKEYLNVRVSSCGNTEIMNNARTEVEKWIKSLDYEPDDYEIKVPEFCDGEAS